MSVNTLSTQAMEIISEYNAFRIGPAICSIPYFNNKTKSRRGSLRVYIGKGEPSEIRDEIESIILKGHIDKEALTSDGLKKLLIDNNIGIDCSGYAYHVLNRESISRGFGKLSTSLKSDSTGGFLDKMRKNLRPIENCSVATLANTHNSVDISIKNIEPGDYITMTGYSLSGAERDHVLIVYSVEESDRGKKIIKFTHSIAYPEDGVYGTGVRHGQCELTMTSDDIHSAIWKDAQGLQDTNLINRVNNTQINIKRLKIFS